MKKDPVVHFEIPADDVDRAQKFYSETFGWEMYTFDMPENSSTGGDPYYGVIAAETDEKNMVKNPGQINGGLMKRKMPNQPFTNYISVDDIDEKIAMVEKNGGKICMPKTEIAPGMGHIALFTDTEGNMMGLHECPPSQKQQ